MYDTNERRRAIEQLLRTSAEPVTGNRLAAMYGVSRQIIVQDMAVLRAGGMDVEASAQGYQLRQAAGGYACVVACHHSGMEQLKNELYTVVDAGACVSDIIVEHPVYGEIVGKLLIGSREAADRLVDDLSRPGAAPLSVVTGGLHLHTITAPSREILDKAASALKNGGYISELAE